MNTVAVANAVRVALAEFTDELQNDPRWAAVPSPFRETVLRHDCAKPIEAVLLSESEFARPRMVSTLTGRMGFGARFVAPMLLEQAQIRGSAEAAVAWLEKVLATRSARGIAVYTLWGFKATDRTRLANDVDLVPFDALPPSRQRAALSEPTFLGTHQRGPGYSFSPPTSALVSSVSIDPYLADADVEMPVESRADLRDRFEAIRHCLAISRRGVVMPGPSWFQYEDPDLEAALLGSGTSFGHQEVVPLLVTDEGTVDLQDAAGIVARFLALPDGVRDRARTAMERVHLAFIRSKPADKALELAIALETLLVESPGENTFKIALRSALLTSPDPQTRSTNRAMIEAAYRLRSALMHSGKAPSECRVRGQSQRPATEVAANATDIAVNVVRRILTDGGLPDWNLVELG
jgi:hypothetical protein